MLSLVFQKLKRVRMTIPSLVLLALASYRTLMSGESIQLVGVCAAVVPFICQFRQFPEAEEPVSPVRDVLSSYILNLMLMLLYLGWVLALTWVGKTMIPAYVPNPHFDQMLCIALCADVVFVSAVIPVCRELNPMQRMIPGLVLTNAMLVFMMLAAELVKHITIPNLPVLCCGFCGLILILTVGMICAGGRKPNQ